MELSCQVKSENVKDFVPSHDFATMAITFYDPDRRDLGTWTIGALRGTDDWRTLRKQVRVPSQARECIVRLGLFGSTGTLWFDDVRLTPSE